MTALLTVPTTRSPHRPLGRTLVLADADPVQLGCLEPELTGRAADLVIRAASGAELERVLGEGGVDLVITASHLGEDGTPFIVYSSLQDLLMRVLVSDTDGTLLASRVLDVDGLVETAGAIIARHQLK